MKKQKIVLLKNKDWSVIDGELCRATNFVPFGSEIKHDKISDLTKGSRYLPHASITIECKKLPKEVTGFICHKQDFENLWEAFKKRKIKRDEEVLIIWTNKHYKYKFFKALSGFLPKIWVMICPKNSYEIMTNPNYRPKLKGRERFLATRPIKEWKPEVME